jgi:RES domain-containing protein
LLAHLKAIPARSISGRFWHQGALSFAPLSCPTPPRWEGRYHLDAGLPTWYASNREQASWAEMFRHLSDEVSPFEIQRRVATVEVTDLQVLDLTDPKVQEALSVTPEQLVDDDLDICQEIGAAAGRIFEGILAPSAALDHPWAHTLAVFPNGMAKLDVVHDRIRPAPPRLADLITQIRIHHNAPAAVLRMLAVLAREGSDAIRRRRRQPESVLDITDSSEAETG